MQYFTGEARTELIFSHSVSLHGKDARSKIVMSDATVQGNRATFPTDAELAKKVIHNCNKIAQREGVVQRQSYRRTSRQLVGESYNGKLRRVKYYDAETDRKFVFLIASN